MNGGEFMVVMIVAVVMCAGLIKSKIRADSQQQFRAGPPQDNGDTARLRDEIRALRDRIVVLERVITDNNRSIELDREIEKLRDNDRV